MNCIPRQRHLPRVARSAQPRKEWRHQEPAPPQIRRSAHKGLPAPGIPGTDLWSLLVADPGRKLGRPMQPFGRLKTINNTTTTTTTTTKVLTQMIIMLSLQRQSISRCSGRPGSSVHSIHGAAGVAGLMTCSGCIPGLLALRAHRASRRRLRCMLGSRDAIYSLQTTAASVTRPMFNGVPTSTAASTDMDAYGARTIRHGGWRDDVK
ncbi:hypothetical protein V8E54_004516 [Elaphomyces granulatus]